MDTRKRELERKASSGDIIAARKLARLNQRASGLTPLPFYLFSTRRRKPAKTDRELRSRPNRNRQRYRKHVNMECEATKCRFCRRHGPYTPVTKPKTNYPYSDLPF